MVRKVLARWLTWAGWRMAVLAERLDEQETQLVTEQEYDKDFVKEL